MGIADPRISVEIFITRSLQNATSLAKASGMKFRGNAKSKEQKTKAKAPAQQAAATKATART
jgi:hypothetical protein